MESLLRQLETIERTLGACVERALTDDTIHYAKDDEVMRLLSVAAALQRRTEALLIESTAQVTDRSATPATSERMTARYGSRSVTELVQRCTRVSSKSAAALIEAGRAIVQQVAPSSGELLPPDLPEMRGALTIGAVGVDGLLAVAGPLRDALSTVGRTAYLAADEELAAAARGEGVDGAPPSGADDLRQLASVWATFLDQDGAEPREYKAMRRRTVSIGRVRDGLRPLRGHLLPEVAAQLELVFDSILNPKGEGTDDVTGPVFVDEGDFEGIERQMARAADDRTRGQKLHDALATALTRLAGSGLLPQIGGAAPTLVVSVRAEDLAADRGFAHVDGCDEPVSLSFARHIACTGAVQRVISNESGRIVAIETSDRIFNHFQRKAIALRDGGCIIPGCRVPASWCELHHVREHAKGGPTSTDNGVMVCWFHHRTLDEGEWSIRMNHGVPEVRGPYWWDAQMLWRAVTRSPVRMRERLVQRQ